MLYKHWGVFSTIMTQTDLFDPRETSSGKTVTSPRYTVASGYTVIQQRHTVTSRCKGCLPRWRDTSF